MLGGLLAPVVSGIFGVIDKVILDKDQAAKIKGELQTMALAGQLREIEQAGAIIVAEAKGSFLQRNWRPGLMCIFMLIILNNYILSPWFGVMHLPLPPEMWELLKIGMGGYIAGRSVEKGIKVWKEKP